MFQKLVHLNSLYVFKDRARGPKPSAILVFISRQDVRNYHYVTIQGVVSNTTKIYYE